MRNVRHHNTVCDYFVMSEVPLLLCKLSILFILLPITVIANELTGEKNSIQQPIIELCDVGYGGTWERFCDPAEINKDFSTYPEHDLKNIRKIICKLKQSNLINRGSLLALGSYKYCSSMRSYFEVFYDKLVEKLSQEDNEKKRILLTRNRPNDTTVCYNETTEAFFKTCAGRSNPCIRMFKVLLARACVLPWLATENILSYIDEVCAGKWVTDCIDWDSVFGTINLRGEI